MTLLAATRALQQELEDLEPAALSEPEAAAFHDRLNEVLQRHDYRYYVQDDPVISDAEYDALYRTLKDVEAVYPALCTPDSVTQRVGGPPLDRFEKVRHAEPLLSLNNAFGAEELRAWYERCRRGLQNTFGDDVQPGLSTELKIDGLAVALTYENGRLTVGATRGDGREGENITRNVATVQAIPLRIPRAAASVKAPEKLEVRGEVFMRRSDFARLNERVAEAGERTYANPRNAAAGSLRQLDPAISARRPLSFLAYAVGPTTGALPETQTELLDWMGALGFPADEHARRFASVEEVVDYASVWAERREDLDYEIDGLVERSTPLRSSASWAPCRMRHAGQLHSSFRGGRRRRRSRISR